MSCIRSNNFAHQGPAGVSQCRLAMDSWPEDPNSPALSSRNGAAPREPVEPATPLVLSRSLIHHVRLLGHGSLQSAHSIRSLPLLVPCPRLPRGNGPQHDAEVALLLPEVAGLVLADIINPLIQAPTSSSSLLPSSHPPSSTPPHPPSLYLYT